MIMNKYSDYIYSISFTSFKNLYAKIISFPLPRRNGSEMSDVASSAKELDSLKQFCISFEKRSLNRGMWNCKGEKYNTGYLNFHYRFLSFKNNLALWFTAAVLQRFFFFKTIEIIVHWTAWCRLLLCWNYFHLKINIVWLESKLKYFCCNSQHLGYTEIVKMVNNSFYG